MAVVSRCRVKRGEEEAEYHGSVSLGEHPILFCEKYLFADNSTLQGRLEEIARNGLGEDGNGGAVRFVGGWCDDEEMEKRIYSGEEESWRGREQERRSGKSLGYTRRGME
jgi:hypothetical protein